MKEKPIIFKDWEIRAIKENRKSQFRRIVKPQPPDHSWSFLPGYKLHARVDVTDGKNGLRSSVLFKHSVERQDAKDSLHQNEEWITCPFGKPGDRLWVRETWMPFEVRGSAGFGPKVEIGYKATNDIRPDGVPPLDFGASLLFDCTDVEWEKFRDIIEKMDAEGDKWLSLVSMPRWASRITLEVTRVRVERLSDMTTSAALREGIDQVGDNLWRDYSGKTIGCRDPLWSFRSLWESINGPGSWKASPWVWVIEFKCEGGAA